MSFWTIQALPQKLGQSHIFVKLGDQTDWPPLHLTASDSFLIFFYSLSSGFGSKILWNFGDFWVSTNWTKSIKKVASHFGHPFQITWAPTWVHCITTHQSARWTPRPPNWPVDIIPSPKPPKGASYICGNLRKLHEMTYSTMGKPRGVFNIRVI